MRPAICILYLTNFSSVTTAITSMYFVFEQFVENSSRLFD